MPAERLQRAAVPLQALTPQAAAGAWLAALLLRDNRAAVAAALAAGAMSVLVAPRAVARRQPEATGPVLRVLSANLLAGRAAAEPLVSLVRSRATDVLAVQELTAGAAARLDRAGLGELLPHAVNDLGLPGSRGNGVYARYPLACSGSIVPGPWAQPVTTISMPSGEVRVVCVHLHTPDWPWSRQATSRWRHELRSLSALTLGDPPVILAGDFNATLDHAALRLLLGQGLVDAASQAGLGLAPTWGTGPARGLLLAIDHILTDRRCAVLSVSVHRLPGSDHRAVYATVRLPD